MFKKFKSSKGDFLAVEVPEYSYNFLLEDLPILGVSLSYDRKKGFASGLQVLPLKETGKIIGLVSEISEKEAKLIYSKQYYYTNGVKISTSSLDIFKINMEVNKIYIDNHLAKKVEYWNEVQKNMSNWLIIKFKCF